MALRANCFLENFFVTKKYIFCSGFFSDSVWSPSKWNTSPEAPVSDTAALRRQGVGLKTAKNAILGRGEDPGEVWIWAEMTTRSPTVSILIPATCYMQKTARHGHVAYRPFCQ